MIPFPVRLILTLLGVGMFAASFAIRSSVDRGLRITRDVGPNLQTDAAAFCLRVIGAVIVMAGLLTWVVSFTAEHHTGIF